MVAAGFSTTAVAQLSAQAYEVYLELDETTKCNEVIEDARAVSALIGMIPASLIQNLLLLAAGLAGDKLKQQLSKRKGKPAPRQHKEEPQFDENISQETSGASKTKPVHAAPKGLLANHPRIANRNPLVDKLAAGADPKTVVPNGTVIVRGGQNYIPQQGNVISAQMGSNASEAAAGLPHGTVRSTTAGEIRAAGGTVELVPEPAYPGGPINTWHVNVTEGPKPAFPAQSVSSPMKNKADRLIVPKELR